MAPASIFTHHDRAVQRLRENVRQATLHGANPQTVGDIITLLMANEITPGEANDMILEIRRQLRVTA